MKEKITLEAKWLGPTRCLYASVPLEAYADAPDPEVDLAGFLSWSDALDERLRMIADGKKVD